MERDEAWEDELAGEDAPGETMPNEHGSAPGEAAASHSAESETELPGHYPEAERAFDELPAVPPADDGLPLDEAPPAPIVPPSELVADIPSAGEPVENRSREMRLPLADLSEGRGRLDVNYRPRGKITIGPGVPPLEVEEEGPSNLFRRQPAHDPQQAVFRHADAGARRVVKYGATSDAEGPTATASTAGRSAGSTERRDIGQPLPRVIVTVSLENARALFQECLEHTAMEMASRFQDIARTEINLYAFERKSAERAANRR